MSRARWAVTTLGLWLAATMRIAAQTDSPAIRPGEITLSAGLVARGGYAIGDRLAELRRSTSGATLPLFRAESAIDPAAGFDLRVGYALTRWLAVEASGAVSRPGLTVSVTGDTEALGAVEVSERVSEYAVGGRAVVYLPYRFGGRGRPYAFGGAEYLRQLHDDRLLVETGQLLFAGAGVRYWLRGARSGRPTLGVRGEGDIVFRSGGIDFDERRRRFPRLSGLATIGF